MKRSVSGLLPLLLFCLSLPACITASAFFGKTVPPRQQILRFNNGTEPRSVDPHKTSGQPEINILINIFESLTVYDPKTLEPRPGVAERWEARDEARKWIFYLRHNARWSDGRPVTAADFVYAWQRGIDPATACTYASTLTYVKNGEAILTGKMDKSALGVHALDEYTLEVEMENPTAFFIQMTPMTVFNPLPRWVIEKWGDRWTEVDKIVTNGAFLLAEHKPYDRMVLIKNPNYWDVANVRLEKAIYLPIEDLSTNLNLYKAGETDVMMSGLIPQAFTKAIKSKRDFKLGTLFSTFYYSFNVKRKPFTDVRVRQAFNLAIDKDLIANKLYAGRGVTPAYAFTPPGVAGYQPIEGPRYNPIEARRLLAEAGYPNGQGFPTVTVYYNTHSGIKQLTEALQQMWLQNLNVKVEMHNEEFQTFQARWENHDFDICRGGWNGDYMDPNTFLSIFATENINNHPGWVNDRYKELLIKANSELNQERRLKLLGDAEKLMISEAPFVPIYYYGMSYLKKPYIKGYEENLLDLHPLKFVWIETEWQPES
ncbi:MAG: peptide ABC transporter substrate-binding protein [Acidobacteriota bacterium]